MINSKYIYLFIILLSIFFSGCSEKFEDPVQENLSKDGFYIADYYVATWGNDSNPGTYEEPWGTWQKAFSTARSGDTVYFRGGVWYPTEKAFGNNITAIAPEIKAYDLGFDGESGNPICYFNYPGETPILDGSKVEVKEFNTGIYIQYADYINFRGLTVRNIKQPSNGNVAAGIGANGCSNFHFENMTVHDIGGRGFVFFGQLGYTEGVLTDTTRFINCDAYNCSDILSQVPGNAADGWKCHNQTGSVIEFNGCRAWNCKDDGFDVSGQAIVYFNNCWSFKNGGAEFIDGNGFKFGAVKDTLSNPSRIVTNCIAAFNSGSGFFDLEYSGYFRNNSRIYNNVAYKNNYGFFESPPHGNQEKPWLLSIYRNNISYQNNTDAFLGVYGAYEESNNTWDAVETHGAPYNIPSDSVTLSDSDFVSLDYKELYTQRKLDGSLPDINFLKLNEESDLIDAGITIDIPGVGKILYKGKAPDIGAYEVK